MQGSTHFFKSTLCSSNPPSAQQEAWTRGQEETWTFETPIHFWGALGRGVGARWAAHLRSLLAHMWAVLNHQL